MPGRYGVFADDFPVPNAYTKYTHPTIDVEKVDKQAELILAQAEDESDRKKRIVGVALKKWTEENNYHYIRALRHMKYAPVDIMEFVESPEFLGDIITIWPKLKDDLKKMCPDIVAGANPVFKIFLSGATGSGKSILSQVVCMYHMYVLCCYDSPQLLFGLAKDTPIYFVMMSRKVGTADQVLLKPVRKMFLAMPFIQQNVLWNKDIDSYLELQSNIFVIKASATTDSILSIAIIGGIIDEINFYDVIDESKRATNSFGLGGRFDQAETLYHHTVRRRKGRFTTKGISPGAFAMVSSVHYNGDFMDRHIREVKETNEQNVFYSEHKQYDVVPQSRYCGKKFKLLISRHGIRPLKAKEQPGVDYSPEDQIESVPIEYLSDFLSDPENALRDILGYRTQSVNSFISMKQKIVDATGRFTEQDFPKWVTKRNIYLSKDLLVPLIDVNSIRSLNDLHIPRYIHVDLSLNRDRCGIAIVKLGQPKLVKSGSFGLSVKTMPSYIVEEAITLHPSKVNVIDIAEVRNWILDLQIIYGINIRKVSYDGYESAESVQAFRKCKIFSENISVDRTPEPYLYLRSTFYQDRIIMPNNEIIVDELACLQENVISGKIDHLPNGSKDGADAICGAVYSASKSREARKIIAAAKTEQEIEEQKQQNRRVVNRRQLRRS